MTANLLSGFIGALLGALSSFCVALYSNKKQVERIDKERRINLLTEGYLLSGTLLSTYRNYNPGILNSASFGIRVDDQFQIKIKEAIEVYDKALNFTHLLPMDLRSRWIEALGLIQKLSTFEHQTPESLRIAQLETHNYLAHLKNSILDLLENRVLREEAPTPNFDGLTLRVDEDVQA